MFINNRMENIIVIYLYDGIVYRSEEWMNIFIDLNGF